MNRKRDFGKGDRRMALYSKEVGWWIECDFSGEVIKCTHCVVQSS